jgi:hypothetical protein
MNFPFSLLSVEYQSQKERWMFRGESMSGLHPEKRRKKVTSHSFFTFHLKYNFNISFLFNGPFVKCEYNFNSPEKVDAPSMHVLELPFLRNRNH